MGMIQCECECGCESEPFVKGSSEVSDRLTLKVQRSVAELVEAPAKANS